MKLHLVNGIDLCAAVPSPLIPGKSQMPPRRLICSCGFNFRVSSRFGLLPAAPRTLSLKTANLRDKLDLLENKVADDAVGSANAEARARKETEQEFTHIVQVGGLLPHQERRLFTIVFV